MRSSISATRHGSIDTVFLCASGSKIQGPTAYFQLQKHRIDSGSSSGCEIPCGRALIASLSCCSFLLFFRIFDFWAFLRAAVHRHQKKVNSQTLQINKLYMGRLCTVRQLHSMGIALQVLQGIAASCDKRCATIKIIDIKHQPTTLASKHSCAFMSCFHSPLSCFRQNCAPPGAPGWPST